MNKQQSLTLDAAGVVKQARFIASPNFDQRPAEGGTVELLVIHNISLPPQQYGGNGIIELFTNQLDPDEHPYYREIHHLRVSSHFLIRRDGELIQFVPCSQRAWHAGQSSWNNRQRCNDFSIGIELEGSDFDAFTDDQYRQLSQLTQPTPAPVSTGRVIGRHSRDKKRYDAAFYCWQPFAAQAVSDSSFSNASSNNCKPSCCNCSTGWTRVGPMR